MAKRYDGVAEFFAATDALTYRDMLSVAELLAMQLETGVDAATIAAALSDAAEAHAEADQPA